MVATRLQVSAARQESEINVDKNAIVRINISGKLFFQVMVFAKMPFYLTIKIQPLVKFMDLIKTGIGISRTIKNVSRFREILTVLSRHGFSELIVKSGLDKLIPGFVLPARVSELKGEDLSNEEWWQLFGSQLRLSFEDLGPSFILL